MAENGPFGTPFLTPRIPPKKFMWVPFLCSFPKKIRHMNFFLGAQNGGFWGGGQKVYVEKVYVLFPSPIVGLQIIGNGPNTVSGSTVSSTEVSEFWAH